MMGNFSSTLARVPDATRSKVEAAISKIHGCTINYYLSGNSPCLETFPTSPIICYLIGIWGFVQVSSYTRILKFCIKQIYKVQISTWTDIECSMVSLSFSSAGKGQFLSGIYVVLVNLEEVAGSKNCCFRQENFTGYHLIRRTLRVYQSKDNTERNNNTPNLSFVIPSL